MIRFPHPIIRLIDVHPRVEQQLEDAGYNVASSRFGTRYKVEQPTAMHPLIDNSSFLNNMTESEIVVIDLDVPFQDLMPLGEKTLDQDGRVITIKPNFGRIDSRVLKMRQCKNTFDRIFDSGGVFIVFAAPKDDYSIYIASAANELQLNNWGFLSVLSDPRFQAKASDGNQIRTVAEGKLLRTSLERFLPGADIHATFTLSWADSKKWKPLAVNRFDDIVAAALLSQEETGGAVLILPDINDKAAFLLDLLENVLPEGFPHLFPNTDKLGWLRQDIYQPPRVVEIQSQIRQLQEVVDLQIAKLNEDIAQEQAKQSFLADLITQTDDRLVAAVETCLKTLGFSDVVNFDEELTQRGSSDMREDLHIRDRSPLVLVEVKGIGGTSTESDALQVTKYLVPRMRELGRTDLHGLAIFNHQRHLAPLIRRQIPFSDDVLTIAKDTSSGFALLTTWNLYKLVRNFIKHGWNHSQVADLFYQYGFIEAVPLHYSYIGTAERILQDISVVGVKIEQGTLKLGDRIAFELDVEFVEQDIQSMQFENKRIETAEVGQLVGITTHFTKEQLRKKPRVFRVDAMYKASPEGA